MNRGAAYLDSSALVKLVADEKESAALAGYLAGFPHRASSRLAMVELRRAAIKKGDAAMHEAELVLDRLEFVELDADVAGLAAEVQPLTLRSLDAIHLASAMSVTDGLDVIVTYDRRLADAAHVAGLSVAAPR